MALGDHDRKIFNTSDEAIEYLDNYLYAWEMLPSKKLKSNPKLPKILYKRRYMIQTMNGEKMQTYRHYDKGWKSGQLFQLHDQTNFLTVRLTSLEEVSSGRFCYKFKNI